MGPGRCEQVSDFEVQTGQTKFALHPLRLHHPLRNDFNPMHRLVPEHSTVEADASIACAEIQQGSIRRNIQSVVNITNCGVWDITRLNAMVPMRYKELDQGKSTLYTLTIESKSRVYGVIISGIFTLVNVGEELPEISLPLCNGVGHFLKRQLFLMNGLHLARHVIHQQILAERLGSGEVGFAAAHLRDLLDKLHQAII